MRYVSSEFNIVDLPSRCAMPIKFVESRWWEGPIWLRLPEKKWPVSNTEVDEREVFSEMKKVTVNTVYVEENVP